MSYKVTKRRKKSFRGVKLPKSEVFRKRFETLVLEKYETEKKFRDEMDISRQLYWQIKYGIWRPKLSKMILIAKRLNRDSREIWV